MENPTHDTLTIRAGGLYRVKTILINVNIGPTGVAVVGVNRHWAIFWSLWASRRQK
jgi:hypothetical protein